MTAAAKLTQKSTEIFCLTIYRKMQPNWLGDPSSCSKIMTQNIVPKQQRSSSGQEVDGFRLAKSISTLKPYRACLLPAKDETEGQYRRSLYAEYAVCIGHQLPGGHHPSCSKKKKKKKWRTILASAPTTASISCLWLNANDHNWWTTMPVKNISNPSPRKKRKERKRKERKERKEKKRKERWKEACASLSGIHS